MGVVVDNKLKKQLPCAAEAIKANWIQSCIHGDIMSKDKDMVIPLYATLVRPNLECCVQFCSLKFKKRCEQSESPKEGREDDQSAGNLPYEERLKKLGLFCLKKRGLKGQLFPVIQYSGKKIPKKPG